MFGAVSMIFTIITWGRFGWNLEAETAQVQRLQNGPFRFGPFRTLRGRLQEDTVIGAISVWAVSEWGRFGLGRFGVRPFRFGPFRNGAVLTSYHLIWTILKPKSNTVVVGVNISTTSATSRKVSETRRCIVETFMATQTNLNCTHSLFRSKRQTVY